MKSTSAKRNTPTSVNAPSVKDVQEFFYLKGLSMVETWQFYNYYHLRSWKNSKGKPIASWKLAAARWTEMICTRYPYLVHPENSRGSAAHKFLKSPDTMPQILLIISPAAVSIESCKRSKRTGK